MEILEINLYNPHIMVIEEIGLDFEFKLSKFEAVDLRQLLG